MNGKANFNLENHFKLQRELKEKKKSTNKGTLVIRFKSWHLREADNPSGLVGFVQADEDLKQQCHMADGPMTSKNASP